MKNNKLKLAAVLLLSSSLLMAPVTAFGDGKDNNKWDDKVIMKSLERKGTFKEEVTEKFVPKGKLTGSMGVYLIVQGLELDGWNSKKNKGKSKWYDSSLQTLKDLGVKLPKNFKANESLTKEEFAFILGQAIQTTGDYPTTQIYIEIADSNKVNKDYMNYIQFLLKLDVTRLDNKSKFLPKDPISQMDAARMIYEAAEYIKTYKEEEQNVDRSITLDIQRVTDQVNKVVVTRQNQPNPGYGIRIAKVEFSKEGRATVYYELLSPEPGSFYPQVITNSKAETYISSQYQVVITPLN